jgi:hypothetical protein
MSSLIERSRASGLVWLAALLLFITASAAGAETLMMPNRDMQMGVSEVVWGVTTLPNAGTTFSIDFGDGTVTPFAAVQSGAVAPNGPRDRSYINLVHNYALANTYTATLTVRPSSGPDQTASVTIRVFDRPSLSDVEKRGLDVNRAIENGLRYLWQSENNRTTFDTTSFATWDGNQSFTALVVLAFENHGYKLPNNDSAPTGIYERYAVQRGLNSIFNGFSAVTLSNQAHLNPCQGSGADCGGLQNFSDSVGYSTAIASLPISGSSALARHVTVGLASIVGKTYGEVLQRNINTVVFNQCDSDSPSRGGWAYGSNGCGSDSSVVGWDLLALFDGEAAGSALPAAVRTEFGTVGGDADTHALDGHRNDNDGSFDYSANTTETTDGNGKNLARTAIGLQGLFFIGEKTGARVDQTVAQINGYFPQGALPAGANALACQNGSYNLGCGYGMFNTFKALKLLGISTLSNVGRPAGPGAIPANDWYAYYVDWLIANQNSPTTSTGGNWTAISFSSSGNGVAGNAALAELILSPVALISPDPTLFGSVGLSQGTPLGQLPDTNPISTNHTVTALVESATFTPIAGATVGFAVINPPSGTAPNLGASGTCAPVGCVTGADGKVTFTYMGSATPGTDNIRANIGTLLSNVLVKNWVVPIAKCDVNDDKKVDITDLNLIRAKIGTTASGPNDQADGNSDGFINIADLRYCALRLTPTPPPTN